MFKKIHIGRIPNKVTDQQLSDIFSKIGRVISVKIVRPFGGEENKNYGYIQMDSEENTLKAIKTLNNSLLEGSRIKVVEAHFLDQIKQEQPYWKKRRY